MEKHSVDNDIFKTDDLLIAIERGDISKNPVIEIDLFTGPIGSGGFRSGNWRIKVDGIPFYMFATVSHYASLNQQFDTLRNSIIRQIELVAKKETFFSYGKERLRYGSQMRFMAPATAE